MRYWNKFENYNFIIEGKRKKTCGNIFTFDIETTSILKLYNHFLPASEYQKLTKEGQDACEFLSFMYIWQFGIDDNIYYGRTFDELRKFLKIINDIMPKRKIVFVHNLSFEFQFLYSNFNISNVVARKSRHVMKCELNEFNIELRCTYMMSNVALKILPKTYKLPVEKMEGDLDYSIIRTCETKLTEKELKYCENDCLVVYYYVLLEKSKYNYVDKIPITFTGHVRREFKNLVSNDWKYKRQVYKAINVDGHIYNLLVQRLSRADIHTPIGFLLEKFYRI